MPIQYNIEIENLAALQDKWAAIPASMKAAIRATLLKAAISVQAIAREEAPVKTGRLRGAIQFAVLSDTTAIVRANTNYAEFVERGTGIYGPYRSPIVRPNGGIMWTRTDPGFGQPNSRGYWFLGREVKGQKANPFMRRAYERSVPIVREEFALMINTVTKEL